MQRVSVFKMLVADQEQARQFYVERLGFLVAEDKWLGDYRWLLVRGNGNAEFSINLAQARTAEERSLVGRQGAGAPLFSIETDDCQRDYAALRSRGVQFEGEPQRMPYGIGATLRDLDGNRIYLNQDVA